MKAQKARHILQKLCRYSFINIFVLISSIILYITTIWDNITIEQVIFHIINPIDGVDNNLVFYFLVYTLTPIFIFNIAYVVSHKYTKIMELSVIMIFIMLSIYAIFKLSVIEYIYNCYQFSNFIEKNYVDPKNVKINFNKKKNLIYIYLESIEISWADKKHGGLFNENLIPELTKLAHDHITFSDGSDKLNGVYPLPGTEWTMAAIFALNTGLPLNVPIGFHKNMESHDPSFPTIISLGDILDQQGYTQEIVFGSDAKFAQRDKFFLIHGNFNIIDYKYVLENKLIPEGYRVFWGIEDKKLFEIAKSRLMKLSTYKKPFNFQLLTVDTHPPNGYLSDFCEKKFGHDYYKNVLYCSDKQIGDFIQWIKNQDFYKDTVIVISGDHPKKTSITDEKYIRKNYTCYINADSNFNRKNRYMSSFDSFPTTLTAIGAEIQGDKLGLGTNLFSKEKTLVEKYGYDFLKKELRKRSNFIENVGQVGISDRIIVNRESQDDIILYTKNNDNILNIYVDLSRLEGHDYVKKNKHGIRALVIPRENPFIRDLLYLKKIDNYLYTESIDINKYKSNFLYIKFILQDNYMLGQMAGNIQLKSNELDEYLQRINNKNYTIFISSKGDFLSKLTIKNKEYLKALGLRQNFNDHQKQYIAVIDKNNIYEEYSNTYLEYNGKFSSNKNTIFRIQSSDNASTVIDNYEFSKNRCGLNFVIYDNTINQVVDSAVFNTCNSEFTHVR